MREVTIKIYNFEELSPKVQERVLTNLRYKIGLADAECAIDDFQQTLAKIEKIFGIEVKYDDYNHFDWHFTNDFNEKPLLRWLNKEIFPYVTKGKYYSGHSRWENGKYHYCQRYSKVLFNGYNCCLTGCYCDYPIDDMLTNAYSYVERNWSITEFIDAMLSKFFKFWEEEVNYCYEDSYIKERMEEEGLEFFKDGKIYGE